MCRRTNLPRKRRWEETEEEPDTSDEELNSDEEPAAPPAPAPAAPPALAAPAAPVAPLAPSPAAPPAPALAAPAPPAPASALANEPFWRVIDKLMQMLPEEERMQLEMEMFQLVVERVLQYLKSR